MDGVPFFAGGTINLHNGETVKDFQLSELPQDKLFIIEFVGVNAFAQPDQILFIGLQVVTILDIGPRTGLYPIVLTGTSPNSVPLPFPTRIFGSQQLRLYADLNSGLTISVARNNGDNDARASVSLSGRIIAASQVGQPGSPQNLAVS